MVLVIFSSIYLFNFTCAPNVPAGEGVILDRSVYSDCVFARVCKREGFISSEGEITTCRLVLRPLTAAFCCVGNDKDYIAVYSKFV